MKGYMPRAKRQQRTRTLRAKDTPASPPFDQLRTGMPALDSIVGVKELRKGKKAYRLIITKEVDEYEPAPPAVKRKKR